ncbi:hypothetical protein ACFQ3W_25920 [Paenibacillus puldeungensis]|uniref:Uncharacterized protein n=1 Tax=Paenibacillus puldeungensis TaxID=696536 RepID=A0ABW3S5D3_9BACL
MKKVKKLLNEIDSLTDAERKELFFEIFQKYVPESFSVGDNYNFWFDGADDVYDGL